MVGVCVLFRGGVRGGGGRWEVVFVENLDLEGSRNVPLRIGRMHCTMMDVTVDGLTGVGRGHVIGRCSPTFWEWGTSAKLGGRQWPGACRPPRAGAVVSLVSASTPG